MMSDNANCVKRVLVLLEKKHTKHNSDKKVMVYHRAMGVTLLAAAISRSAYSK